MAAAEEDKAEAPEAEAPAEETPSKAKKSTIDDDDLFKYDGVAESVFKPEEQIGITAPLGFFDPLGFCKDKTREEFRRLRAAEIKHGRVAMMASVGAVFEHYVKFPFFPRAGSTWESKFDAIVSVPGVYFFPIFIIGIFFFELSVWAQEEEREPGDFGDPFGLKMYTPDMRNRELNNGRAAMFAAVGIIAAQIATGKDAVQQLGLA